MAEIVDTLKLEIDQALRDVNRIEQALDRALAPVELRIDDSSLQNVESNLRDIRSVVDDTTDSVRLTAAEYREVSAAIERGITPARAIADATGQVQDRASLAEANFRDLAQALDVSEDEARRLTAEILDSQQAAQRLEEATRDVVRQLGLSDDEADRLTRSLRQADRAAADINTRGTTLVGTFGSLRTAIAAVGGLLAVVGGAQILSGAVRGISTALTQFQALNESINAVQVTFGSASQTVLDFGEISAQAAGLSAAAFQQAVVPIGSVLTNFGFNAREAADASVVLVQRAADLASVFNTDVSEALLAINSALVGQVEPLRRYGAEINQARVQQFALATGIAASKDEFDLQAQVAARVGLILQDTARVQGDFANTSDQLANAQRIAAAEVENFAAVTGEQLAPAMAALVALLPEVLEGVQQLVPAFAAGADSAAAFFESVGEGGGAGFRTFAAAARGVVGTLGDVTGGVRDFNAFLTNIFVGNLEGAGDAFDQFATRADRTGLRSIGLGLAKQLDAGTEAVDAFATSVNQLGRLTGANTLKVFQQGFRDFAIQAGLSKRDLLEVTAQIIKTGDAAGLSADEIRFLEDQFALLRNTLFPVGNEVEQAARAMGLVADVTPIVSSSLQDVQRAAADAGLSLSDLVTAADPLAAELFDSLSSADQFALKLEAVRTGAITAADAFTTNLQPSLIDVRQGLRDLNEDGRVSLSEFTRNLETAAQDFLNFITNIGAIAVISPELAAKLRELPEEVRNQLAGQIADLSSAEIEAIAESFTGPPDLVADAILDIYVTALSQVDARDPRAVTNLLGNLSDTLKAISPQAATIFAGGFQPALNASFADLDPPDLTPILTASVEGMNAQAITASLDDALFASFADVEFPDTTGQMTRSIDGWSASEIAASVRTRFEGIDFNIDFTEQGREARATFFDGLSLEARDEAAQVRDSILNVLDTAIERDSPPKLFLRAGEESSDAFWSAFEQGNLQLRTPIADITGRITTGTTAATGGGVNVNINLDHASLQDPISDVARMAQIASSIANTYRQVT